MSYYGFPQYVSVAEKRAKAMKAIDKLKKKIKISNLLSLRVGH